MKQVWYGHGLVTMIVLAILQDSLPVVCGVHPVLELTSRCKLRLHVHVEELQARDTDTTQFKLRSVLHPWKIYMAQEM